MVMLLTEVIKVGEEVGTVMVTFGLWISGGIPFISIDCALSLLEVS
jgi:hypothetical protein